VCALSLICGSGVGVWIRLMGSLLLIVCACGRVVWLVSSVRLSGVSWVSGIAWVLVGRSSLVGWCESCVVWLVGSSGSCVI
jgi:hypothetical protein